MVKKTKNTKEKKVINKKNDDKRKRTVRNKYSIKSLVIFVLFIAVCLAIIFGIFMLVRRLVMQRKYSYYTEKMEWYGYNKLYDNESAKISENVTSDEIAKMVAGVLYNRTNKEFAKSRLYGDFLNITDTNESWIAFAKTIPLKSAKDIVMGEKASKLQVASLIIEGIENVYGRNIEITEQFKEKYRKDCTEEELDIIDKAISIGILKNSKSDVNEVGMIKGELNKMLITVAEKYSMMYYNSRYLEDGEVSVVTDEAKLPENADIYPYVVDSISNDIYEIEMSEMLSEISETPKEVYDVYGDAYDKVEENITKFFDVVLNVDYRTIDTESFIEALNPYVSYSLNSKVSDEYVYREAIENYVNYVKENEIVLSGKVTPLLPIIYSNGMLHFARCKIEFEVINSKTDKNLLLWDAGTTYNGKVVSVLSDVVVTPTISSKAFRVFTGASLTEYISRDTSNIITKE